MGSHSYEVAYWTASNAVQEDASLVQPAVDIIKTKTPYPILTGIRTESPEFFIVVAWDKTETHKAFMSTPEYRTLSTKFAPLFPVPRQGGVTMVHAHFDRSPLPALGAPVTEHAYLVPASGVSLAQLGAVLRALCDTIAESSDGVSIGAAWATMEERPEELLLVAGWRSVEEHWKYVSPGGAGHKGALKMRAMIWPEKCFVAHVPYMKHQWDQASRM